ncbi:hypothetical protein [Roseinatronobacter alkalisoli]|uniref:Uncharacterized protein n=1 Tax=Roseinatronobacter alkalisoli TaxID=3028235 RepID=A0ABT5TBG2_9RHOB|nr:hypothetical protein [Roseinatronobacter sp. HJB301]MDD7972457.1 hypothetical protein [Roseinatronobacter sp. HJB301]
MSFLSKNLFTMKAAKFPAFKPAPIKQDCNIDAAREKLIQKKIDALEAKAAKLEAKADSLRDHYQDKADGMRALYDKKADFYSCKSGHLSEKFAAKFSALGDKKADLLEAVGAKKAAALECAADKLKAKADMLREKLSKDEDPCDDDLKDDDDDDITDDDGDDKVGTPLPEDASAVKFFLNVEDNGPSETNYFLTIQAPENDDDFTLEDAYEQALSFLEENNLQLNAVNQANLYNADGEKIAEYKLVDDQFVKIGEVMDGLWVEISEDDLAASIEDEDDDDTIDG